MEDGRHQLKEVLMSSIKTTDIRYARSLVDTERHNKWKEIDKQKEKTQRSVDLAFNTATFCGSSSDKYRDGWDRIFGDNNATKKEKEN